MEAIEALLKRHRDFWRMRGDLLISVNHYTPLEKGEGIPLAGGRRVTDNTLLTPEMVDPRLFLADYLAPLSPVTGDYFHALAPYGLCWTEAIIGCPIQISVGSVWSKPFLKDWDEVSAIRLTAGNRWLQKLLDFTGALIEKSEGRIPVTLPLTRGLTDMAAAALGPERLCVALKRQPSALGRLLEAYRDAFIAATGSLLSLIPRFHGGYVTPYGVWAPGTIARTQADNSVLISSEDYRTHILPYEASIIKSFDYSLFHLHSGGSLHVAEAIIDIPELGAVEVAIDPNGPSLGAILPVLQRIHSKKPLIITGPVSQRDLEKALASLAHSGLGLRVQRL